ncbi:MAG: hypothetical protein ACLGIK_13520, partial [Gemmatimonadota bacterium]
MNVIMLAPGYPGEMPYFCRALARNGAKVYGLSDVAYKDLPALTREHLSGYLQVANFTDEEAVVRQVVESVGSNTIDRVVCMWEPGVVLAAKLREATTVVALSQSRLREQVEGLVTRLNSQLVQRDPAFEKIGELLPQA